MTDRMRTLTDEALSLHAEGVAYAVESSKLAQKQVQLGFDTARASLELTKELQQSALRMAADAVWPATDADA